MADDAAFSVMARTDASDWLIEAGDPLASIHQRMGGVLPGPILAPSLLELVRRCRLLGMDLAQAFQAQDHEERFSAWAEVQFDAVSGGCAIHLLDWQAFPLNDLCGAEVAENRAAIIRHLAELSARLGPQQELLAVQPRGEDTKHVASLMRERLGARWTDLVEIIGNNQEQPLQWRLPDGVGVRLHGSEREWKAHLIPVGSPASAHAGFELHLVAEDPFDTSDMSELQGAQADSFSAIGREIEPVLRKPISRIIVNAETIHSQLAGPISEEYTSYAADIAAAGEHLLTLMEDLVDIETIEDEQFSTASDPIDLADIARRAATLLVGRAQERGITVEVPVRDMAAPALGEARRVLQILLNLLGNAIRYAPAESRVLLSVAIDGGRAHVSVEDEGKGLSSDQQIKIFDKFERLGRSGDGGSGLGLYISRRLARAMNGDLTVESRPGAGARFTLELPADEAAGC